MESLSKEKNLILGLLLGVALAIAISYAQPSELRASAQVPVSDGMMCRAIDTCMDGARINGVLTGDIIDLLLRTRCP